MACSNPVYVKKLENVVPCGKCYNCLQDRRKQWTLRLQNEHYMYSGDAIFITLTYDDNHLPQDRSVSKRDIQLFMKRLRKYYKTRKLKYYIASEYGGATNRPHYHGIIFGIRCGNSSKSKIRLSNFISKHIWKQGYCYVGTGTKSSISYCAKYIVKNFLDGKEYYTAQGLTPPFSLKSTGLGLSYLIKYFDRFAFESYVTCGKFKVGIPRYYKKKLVELGYEHEDFRNFMYNEYYNNIVPTIMDELKSYYGKDYCNPYQTIASYYNGFERDPNWFVPYTVVNYDTGETYTELGGNHTSHFWFHYLKMLGSRSAVLKNNFRITIKSGKDYL
ncbi:replication initiator protein [Peromfec virus RodF8_42]|uniref:Replication initiator protein n=1 Tax=Peromfec virus RodF8_42 TaxID=2929375 RepID=A0A976N229_9VIRU|nr:replication initiator protein [Peromfec virus RodF8_42]